MENACTRWCILESHLDCMDCLVSVDLGSWHFRLNLVFSETDFCIGGNNCTLTQYNRTDLIVVNDIKNV